MENHKVSYKSCEKFYHTMCSDFDSKNATHKILTCIVDPINETMRFRVEATNRQGMFSNLTDAIKFYNKGI